MPSSRQRRWIDSQDALADVPDKRDRLYMPTLRPLASRLLPFRGDNGGENWWNSGRIRDQGNEPSCVGHALAAVVDHMRAIALHARLDAKGTDFSDTHLPREAIRKFLEAPYVSAKMLYYMAQFHDEMAGEDYRGSSLRGGLKGFFYNGVCTLSLQREFERDNPSGKESRLTGKAEWHMTRTMVEQARAIQLGAYYRVRPRLSDMHAALNEAKAIAVTATTHTGWQQPVRNGDGAEIPFESAATPTGRRPMHAVALVGYDETGFWVQNSWGPGWGDGGLARWLYEDWAANVVDAWALQVAVLPPDGSAPTKRRTTARGSRIDRSETHFLDNEPSDFSGPSRLDVLGHLVPFRDGILDFYGPYNVNLQTLDETFKIIRTRYSPEAQKHHGRPFPVHDGEIALDERRYKHILIYFLGGWSNEARLANDLSALIPTFLKQGIYPFFVAWETPLFGELEALVRREIDKVAKQTVETSSSRRAGRDRLVEGHVALAGNRVLRELRASARRMFKTEFPDPDFSAELLKVENTQAWGTYCLGALFEAMADLHRKGGVSYHFAAHGFGAQLLVECLAHQGDLEAFAWIRTCTLISPLVATHRLGGTRFADLPCDLPTLFDSLVARSDQRRRPRPADRLEIERLRLLVLGSEAMRLDRFSDEYARAWPELWARAMGHEVLTRKSDQDQVYLTRTMDCEEGEGVNPARWRRLLGLPKEAAGFVNDCDGASFDARVEFIHSTEDDADSSLHHELGFHPQVLDRLVHDIQRNPLAADDRADPATTVFTPGGRKLRFSSVDRES